MTYHEHFTCLFCSFYHNVCVFNRICYGFFNKDMKACFQGIKDYLFMQFCRHNNAHCIKAFGKHFFVICKGFCFKLGSHGFDSTLVHIGYPCKLHAFHLTIDPDVILAHGTRAYYSYSYQNFTSFLRM
ncbi:hypothetical protein DSECCO2_436830 [anaerobic digester metagenome]